MKVVFLGTRGFINAKNRRHWRHTSTLISYKQTQILIDCGIDWQNKVFDLPVDAIVITHAHADHAEGLKYGSPACVYATKESWHIMDDYAIHKEQKHTINMRKPFTIGSITLEAFRVEHSLCAPGVGFRVTAGKNTVFIVHDVISIEMQQQALQNIDLYIGDGATITRSIMRRSHDHLIGHTTIRNQLNWCQDQSVPRAVFTHCGSQIVKGDERKLGAQVRGLGKERDVEAEIAHDGMEILLR